MRSLGIAASGMLAQQLNVDVISNNLSNLTTTGFKRQRAEFQDLLYQQQVKPGATSNEAGTILPSGIQIGLGVKPGAVYRINEQGVPIETKNNLDVMIRGRGFFTIELPNGELGYTRAGAFTVNEEGQVVTQDGNAVSGIANVPSDATSISISETGTVEAFTSGSVDPENLGQIELAVFINENGLEALGANMFRESVASGEPITGFGGDEGFGNILQGYLENSNVDSVKEITNLIVAQRSYEMNSKVITASDEMLRTATQLRS